MIQKEKMVSLAVNTGIGFGSKLSPKQLIALGQYLEEDTEVELTTFQQLYIQVPESKLEETKQKLQSVGFSVYDNGLYVKSLRTCNFCKGAEEEGMPVAIELDKRIRGRSVPFPLKPAYTGCPNACGEPLVNDIGVVKRKEFYEVYVGGQGKGLDAKTGQLLFDKLKPEELYEVVDAVIYIYSEHGKKREKLSKFINRYGFEELKEEVKLKCIAE